MFPVSISLGTYESSSGNGDGGSSPFTGLIFGDSSSYTITPSGGLSVYDDWWDNDPSLTALGTPYYYIQFGPGTAADSNQRALNYTKDLVSWITDRAVANVAVSTNYSITSSDFSRLTIGYEFGNPGGENFDFTFAYYEPASSGTYISIENGVLNREYMIRFGGGWTVSSGVNDSSAGSSSVPTQYWKKTT